MGVFVVAALVLWFTVTSSQPLVPMRAAPTAEDVGAGREAYHRLRETRGNKSGISVRLGPAELAGLSAVASHGFRPDGLTIVH